jgi:uncharacterized protein (DUF488 family)
MTRRKLRIFTIGVYGASRETFFEALERAGADVLIDIGLRRAVRGPRYTFANAVRLIAELEQREIAYRHELGLAPTAAMLKLQHEADARAKRLLSERTELTPAYVKRYRAQVLERFDFDALAAELEGYRAPVLMCVERIPAACHRSLAAPRLARALGTDKVEDLVPAESAG